MTAPAMSGGSGRRTASRSRGCSKTHCRRSTAAPRDSCTAPGGPTPASTRRDRSPARAWPVRMTRRTLLRALNASLPAGGPRVRRVRHARRVFTRASAPPARPTSTASGTARIVPPMLRLYAWHVPQSLDAGADAACRARRSPASTISPRSRARAASRTRSVRRDHHRAVADRRPTARWSSRFPARVSCATWCGAWSARSSRSVTASGPRPIWRGSWTRPDRARRGPHRAGPRGCSSSRWTTTVTCMMND